MKKLRLGERKYIVQDHTCPDPVPSNTQCGAGGLGEPVVFTDLIMLSDTLKWLPANHIKYIASFAVLIPHSVIHTSFPLIPKHMKSIHSPPHLMYHSFPPSFFSNLMVSLLSCFSLSLISL